MFTELPLLLLLLLLWCFSAQHGVLLVKMVMEDSHVGFGGCSRETRDKLPSIPFEWHMAPQTAFAEIAMASSRVQLVNFEPPFCCEVRSIFRAERPFSFSAKAYGAALVPPVMRVVAKKGSHKTHKTPPVVLRARRRKHQVEEGQGIAAT